MMILLFDDGYHVIYLRFCLCKQNALWEALRSGDIDLVVSDHSPCTPDLKVLDKGDFMEAWGGISSLQYGMIDLII